MEQQHPRWPWTGAASTLGRPIAANRDDRSSPTAGRGGTTRRPIGPRSLSLLLGAMMALLWAPQAMAASSYLTAWGNLYSGSTTDNNAGCQTCHAASTQNLNPYGEAICNSSSGNITARIQSVEGLDSDGDGNSNLAEINANAQPGWTSSLVPTYQRGNCNPTGNSEPAPPGVSGDLDPAAAPTPEVCDDNVDNDGDGLIDCADTADCNGFVISATNCGVGACAATGDLICQGGTEVNTCTPGQAGTEGPFGNATCSDGIDNDCDGTTDGLDANCAQAAEICDNGVDDNGNGLVDCADPLCNGFVIQPTVCGVGACTSTGNLICQNGGEADTCVEGIPVAEVCDGLDNNCDGAVDNNIASITTTCGTGACSSTGTGTCVNGQIVSNCTPGTPSAEVCNDFADNDCDGLVDCTDSNCGGSSACQATATTPKNQFNILMNYELGMHCTGFEFSYCCVLPPYNSILAQVVKTEKGSSFPKLLTADPNVGLDALGRPTVVRDTDTDSSGNFKKYQLRYWHDAQPRNDGRGAPQSSTLISVVEGNSMLMWNTKFDAAATDANGALVYSGYNGSTGVMQGDGDFVDDNDNYWNGAWNHLYIYADPAHPTAAGPNLEGHGNTGVEAQKKRLGVHVVYPENTGAALHPMGPGVVGAGFDNVLTFSKDEGTVVYTQMKVLEDLPVMLTSPRIWEALGLPLTPFEDSINFFGDPGAIDEDSLRPYVRMHAQLEEYPSGNPVLDNGNPVIGLGTAPIDIPNCERCHSLANGDSVNSAQNGYPVIDQMVQDEMAFWNAYYDIGPGDSDWYSRLKGAAISILAIHDDQHGTSFTADWPANGPSADVCTAGDPNTLGDPCTANSDCNTTSQQCSDGTACTSDSNCGGSTMVCTRVSGVRHKIGDPCTENWQCGRRRGICGPVGGGTCDTVTQQDGVCQAGASPDGTVQYTRLGHESVVCQRCHADNVIAVVKSAYGPGGDLIPPLTEAMHNNHKHNPFSDSRGRNGGCQGCHPAHRSDGSMDGYPITEAGLNAYAESDNRDASGGCFVGRDVHSNRHKDTDGAGTPEHLNAVGEWLQSNVAFDLVDGEWKGIWCTNCHSQLGQELWKTDNWSDPVNNVGTTLRNAGSLGEIATGLGVSLAQVESWLDPKVPDMAPDNIDHTSAVWTGDPGLCDYVGSLFGGTASPYQDGNVATIEVALNDGVQACSTPVSAAGPDCDGNGQPDFFICGSVDVDGDFSVNALTFCTTPDCVVAAQASLSNSTAVPVPMSAATDGRDHWLSPGEPHCADCHAAPYVEQSGTQHPYPPFNYPNKPALFRYTRGHQDITCQGCHESTHGLYPVVGNIDTTSYEQAAGLNADGSHGPLKCGACHDANAAGTLEWMRSNGYFGNLVNDFDGAIGWAHTYTDEADPRASVCLNCHGDESNDVSDDDEDWLEHTMRGRVSRATMDKVEMLELGHVAGATNPAGTVCRGCHEDETDEVSCSGEDSREWKRHLTEGRVSESVWEAVSQQYAGSTCGY